MPLTTVAAIKAEMARVKVVSFDVFDTLVARAVASPTDVFDMIRPGDGGTFRAARVAAEISARELSVAQRGHSEVTIEQIYRRLPKHLQSVGVGAELNAEFSAITVRPLGRDLLNFARSLNKRVVAVSDTYLSSDQIKELLLRHRIEIDDVYVSSEHEGGKYSGVLFEHVISKEGVEPADVLHVGDNRQSDLFAALKCGLTAIHVPGQLDLLYRDSSINLGTVDLMLRSPGLLGSATVARLARLREAGQLGSAIERFAHLYGGPLLYGYARWLAERARALGLSKLLLMARDGGIVGKVLSIVAPDIQTEVVRISRRTCVLPTILEDVEALPLVISHDGTHSLREIVADLFDRSTEILDSCAEFGIEPDAVLNSRAELERFRKLVVGRRELFLDQIAAERQGLESYLRSLGLPRRDVALVDTGWGLSSQRAIERVLGEKLRGLYLGTHGRAHNHELIEGMVTVLGNDPVWVDILESAVELVELPFISNEDQIERITITNDGDIKFKTRKVTSFERARRAFVADLQNAILSYCRDLEALDLHLSHDDIRDTLRFAFRQLTAFPTPSEYWTLGEILHDRYVHNGTFADMRNYWRTGGPAASPKGLIPPSHTSKRRLVRAFQETWRVAGPKIAVLKVFRYVLLRSLKRIK